ncbi:MAG: hypothetical protein ACR2IT_01260, partial [Pirellulales bacterium]
MATLRCSTSHLVLLFAGAACCPLTARAADNESSPPRTLMRLPGWIESYGDDGESPSAPAAATSTLDLRSSFTTRPVADWSSPSPTGT